MSKSRLFEGIYYKYKQYYKNIPVKGGGFTILIEPQDVDAFIDSYFSLFLAIFMKNVSLFNSITLYNNA